MLSALATSSTSHGTALLRRFGARHAQFVGIDVGIDRVNVSTLGVKPHQTTGDEAAGYGWLSRSAFDLPVDPFQPPPADWVDRVVNTLAERLPRCVDGDRAFAVITLPIPWIHYQTTIGINFEAIQTQCDAMFVNSIFESQAHLSSWPVRAGSDQTVIAATSKQAACRVAETVTKVGFQVQGILPHGVALLKAAPSLTSLAPSTVVLLEFAGGLVALNNKFGCGLCRNLPPHHAAMGEPTCIADIKPWLNEIASEVLASIRFATRVGAPVDPQAPVLICGQAAHFPGVDVALASMLSRPVARWRYAGRMRPSSSVLEPEAMETEMAVSLSLASCAMHAPSQGSRLR